MGFNFKGILKEAYRHKVSAFFILVVSSSIYYDYSLTQQEKLKKTPSIQN